MHISLIALTAPSKLFVYVLEDPVRPKAPRRQGCLSLRRVLIPAVFVYKDCSIYIFEWKHLKAWVAPIEAAAAIGGEQCCVLRDLRAHGCYHSPASTNLAMAKPGRRAGTAPPPFPGNHSAQDVAQAHSQSWGRSWRDAGVQSYTLLLKALWSPLCLFPAAKKK